MIPCCLVLLLDFLLQVSDLDCKILLIFVRGVLLPLYQSLFEPVKILSNTAERRESKSGEKKYM